ncbi:hypothetical protein PanWU01x14_185200 [Parasponia andersonii]|uniref:Uncharacterized protein n=1 Tax=Parasponia andersonii TaxID=3476 RepID=A0A2P5C447_PARAD|nr:hypothetical protein PanWU01x14_185200 [Parasponia andersonii]
MFNDINFTYNMLFNRAGQSPRDHGSEATLVRLAHEVPPAWSREWGNAHAASAWGATCMASMQGCSRVANVRVANRVASEQVSPPRQHGWRARLLACATSYHFQIRKNP